jgi:hypothetical protein
VKNSLCYDVILLRVAKLCERVIYLKYDTRKIYPSEYVHECIGFECGTSPSTNRVRIGFCLYVKEGNDDSTFKKILYYNIFNKT